MTKYVSNKVIERLIRETRLKEEEEGQVVHVMTVRLEFIEEGSH